MQADCATVPVGGALGRLVQAARRRVAGALAGRADALGRAAAAAPVPPPFGAALRAGAQVTVIAELKRRSPSQGVLREHFDLTARARAYRDGGAAALSVLTEETEFAGSVADLESARASVDLPLLRKDFIIHPLQILEARAAGASAVLLIARALGAAGIETLVRECARAGVEPLVEVRSAEELKWACDAGAGCIGVNARDLESLAVDLRVVEDLLPRIPAGVCAVAESAIATPADVQRVAARGADAVLVGSALSRAADAAAAVRALGAIERGPARGR